MKVLVTGAGGFVGRHLVAALRAEGEDVVAAGHGAEEDVDLRWKELVDDLVDRVRPDRVYHLAAASEPLALRLDPAGAKADIVQTSAHVSRALAEYSPGARLLVVSSAVVYGRRAGPFDEAAAVRPTDLYGADRASAERIATMLGGGLGIVVARPFPHTGPGQVKGALAEWASAGAEGAAAVEAAHLDVEQDWSDVRDVVRAYRVLMERGAAGEAYPIASGRAVSLGWLFRRLAGPGVEPLEPKAPGNGPLPVGPGAAGRLRALGWAPRYDLETTLADLRRWYERGCPGHGLA